jgi:hypothetical protein
MIQPYNPLSPNSEKTRLVSALITGPYKKLEIWQRISMTGALGQVHASHYGEKAASISALWVIPAHVALMSKGGYNLD